MRRSLPRRTHEMTLAAKLLQRLGWVIEGMSLSVEESENGAHPRAQIVARYEPVREHDIL